MKRLLFSLTMFFCSFLTFAQFSGTISDSQGVSYTANDDDSTCYVRGHMTNYSTTITIPEVYEGRTVTSIGNGAFDLCRGLTSVTIPNSVTSIGKNAFGGCKKLTSVTIPNSVTEIVYSAFNGCYGLTSIIVENNNPKYDSRDNCNAIIETATNTLHTGCKNTDIPNSVTSIGERAFDGCKSLTSVTIPNSVTSIGESAFYDCFGLTSVTIPNSVTSIGNSAFYGCI